MGLPFIQLLKSICLCDHRSYGVLLIELVRKVNIEHQESAKGLYRIS